MDAAGERFLMVVEPASATGIRQRIHLNVFDEVERRIAAQGGR